MPSATETLIKQPILDLIGREFAGRLTPASEDGVSAREFSLAGTPHRFRADFAYRTPENDWVFIEDDDPQRALNNIVKYWVWMADAKVQQSVHLIHLIRPCVPRLARFASENAMIDLPSPFVYHPIDVEAWDSPEWLNELETVLDQLVLPGGDGAPPDPSFVGMWAEREDMADSAAWVRGLRESSRTAR